MRQIALLLFLSMIACTPAVLAQGCDWSGTWITGWTGQSAPSDVKMDLQEVSPNTFAGTYEHDGGQIFDASVFGNVLNGTWIQSGGLHAAPLKVLGLQTNKGSGVGNGMAIGRRVNALLTNMLIF
jgi:hypothetical protein